MRRVWGGERMFVPLTGNGDVNIWCCRTSRPTRRLTADIIYKWPLKPPLRRANRSPRCA